MRPDIERYRPIDLEVVELRGGRLLVRGHQHDVLAHLARLHRRGELVQATRPIPAVEPGRVEVSCWLLPRRGKRRGGWRAARGWLIGAAVTAAVGVVAGVVWVLYQLVEAVTQHLVAIVVVLALVTLLGGGGACVVKVTVEHRRSWW
jgi:anti-sigma-K factor RskA